MYILGIESSCDETAAAVVKDGLQVASSVVATQLERHKPFGGVIPEIAAREHLACISEVVEQAMHSSALSFDDIDAIAVTQGPGLIGALLVGVHYAKGLALSLQKPLIPVNHVHAHVLGALLDSEPRLEDIFPSLAVVVSGGHTNLYYMSSVCEFKLIGYSIDDACGESFDKVAKLLGMGYPGGPAIEKKALGGDATRFSMPRMMSGPAGLQMSYSGLKTHMVNFIRQHKDRTEQDVADLCACFQKEALGQIARKLKIALESYPDTRSIIVAGGVSANQAFREMLAPLTERLEVVFPRLKYCSDNAAMIASLANYEYQRQTDKTIYQDQSWEAYAQYPFAEFL